MGLTVSATPPVHLTNGQTVLFGHRIYGNPTKMRNFLIPIHQPHIYTIEITVFF
jgi:hypothetical protein